MEEIKLEENSNSSSTKSNKKGVLIGVIGFTILIAIVVGISIALIGGDEEVSTNYLTYSNYLRIENGMTYEEVVNILGGQNGELESSAGSGGYTLSYYSWSNNSGTRNIIVGFENGKVCAKSQIGLS